MRIVIGGCGRVGSTLATGLSIASHQVAVIDHCEDAFIKLGANYSGTTHLGKTFDRETLEAAGIDHADAFVAVTSGDNSNVVSALVAKDAYRVPHVVARIFDPRRAEIYRRLGLVAVSSVAWSTSEIMALLLHTELTTDLSLGDGQVRLVSIEVPHRLHERSVDALNVPGETQVIALVRAGNSFMPHAGSPMHAGDIVHAAVADNALGRFGQMLAP